MRVAIIGAGPSGISAAKALLAESGVKFSVTIFERRQQAGGAWNYTPFGLCYGRRKPQHVPSIDPALTDPPRPIDGHDGQRQGGQTQVSWDTPMYRDLYTNIPAELMAYGDRPFYVSVPPTIKTFPHRDEVLQYLRKYADDVKGAVRFGCNVKSILKIGTQWQVVWCPSDSSAKDVSSQTQEEFDRVVMASGHYEVPKIPDIQGLSEYDQAFPEKIQHSKYYRAPEEYRGKTVLVIGAGPSAIDISAQLGGEAKNVYRSARSENPSLVSADGHVEVVPQISKLHPDGSIALQDGRVLRDIDVLLFCTGYLYSFPPLKLESGQNVVSGDGEYLKNLYEQCIYIPDPTLAFLAMQMSIVPFPIAEAQSCFLARMWSGRIRLPSTIEMSRAEAEIMSRKGLQRQCMVLGHPEDGYYIERLRQRCLEADRAEPSLEHHAVPVNWLAERVELRKNTRKLKQDWLLAKETNAKLQSGA